MHGDRKSDSLVVPGKHPNKAAKAAAEGVEERGLAKGISSGRHRDRTQRRAPLPQPLRRVHQAARREKKGQLTALWHHVHDIERLRAAYRAIRPSAAPGVDGVTWKAYGENLEDNLQELSSRLRRGAYRAQPVRRVYIPKSGGQKRPIGVTTLEDKLVQRATTDVLNAVYEADFKGFSYGFRPGRGQHNALDALWVGLMSRKVNVVLDADIRGFFDAMNHEWLLRFVKHRIGDSRVLRHLEKWLKAGILEDGKWRPSTQGTPQGGSVSPLLANVYLHYAFDLWADQWRRRYGHGDIIMVRYADDIVVGFEKRRDAERFRSALGERLGKFGLELHPDKTCLLEFGRYAADRRSRRGLGRPEVFRFLGFVHSCGTTREGRFTVRRRPDRKRMSQTLKRVKVRLRKLRYRPVPEQGAWLAAVIRGYGQYFGVPGTSAELNNFRKAVSWHWYRALRRRSQKTRLTWERMLRLMRRWLPIPHIVHPNPFERLRV